MSERAPELPLEERACFNCTRAAGCDLKRRVRVAMLDNYSELRTETPRLGRMVFYALARACRHYSTVIPAVQKMRAATNDAPF